jgi:hypothetical protein
LADPAFGIHFVRSYHRADGWLPNEVWSASLWRAFCALRYDQELRDEEGKLSRTVLRGVWAG